MAEAALAGGTGLDKFVEIMATLLSAQEASRQRTIISLAKEEGGHEMTRTHYQDALDRLTVSRAEVDVLKAQVETHEKKIVEQALTLTEQQQYISKLQDSAEITSQRIGEVENQLREGIAKSEEERKQRLADIERSLAGDMDKFKVITEFMQYLGGGVKPF